MKNRRVHLRGYADLQRALGDGPIPFVAATQGPKADGLDLQMDRLDLARYQANPVIMYGHEYWGRESLPIGRADNVRIEGEALRVDIAFDLEDDFARSVDRKIRGRFLNAVSVGFGAYGIDPDSGVPERWELYEISVVPLPMDPDAVADPERALALARALAGGRGDPVDEQAIRQAIAALQRLLPNPPAPPAPPSKAAKRQRLRALEASL